MFPIIVALAAASLQSGPTHEYGDWISVCDNTLACQVTLSRGMPDSEEIALSVVRAAGGSEMPTIDVYWFSGNAKVRALVIDGVSHSLPFGSADRIGIVRALAGARLIEVVGNGTRTPVSAIGTSAAFRDMDARQGRVGTTTAVVATGDASPSIVPSPRPEPVLIERRAGGGPVMRPSKTLLAKWRKNEDCPEGEDGPGETSWPVDMHTAAIIIRCDRGGARNATARIKVGSRTDGTDAHDAEFDYDASMVDVSSTTNTPLNPELDIKTHRMGSGENGGSVEAGSYQQWIWDGRRFRSIVRSSAYGVEFRAAVMRR